MRIQRSAIQRAEARCNHAVKYIAARAFTLPELLIAVVLLIVLISLVYPAGRSVYQTSKQVSCMNNLRAYGASVLALIADKGGYPEAPIGDIDFKKELVPAYLPDVPQCPLANREERLAKKSFFYGGNAPLVHYYRNLKGIPAPAARVVLAAEYYGIAGFNAPTHFNMTMWGIAGGEATDAQTMAAKEGSVRRPQYHGSANARGLNLLFLDGSGKMVVPTGGDWRKPDTLGTADNGGYFYDRDQFRLMSLGKMKVQ